MARLDPAAAHRRHPGPGDRRPGRGGPGAGQALPPLPPGTEVVSDPREGLGPVQGLAAGLAALAGRAEIAFVSATDLPFLHPAFVRRVVAAAAEGADVGLRWPVGTRSRWPPPTG